MPLFVRERPSTRLSVVVKPPGANSTQARWGNDDANPQNKPNALTFASAMPGGFSTMSCVLERNPRYNYSDLAELSTVTVYGFAGSVAWQGRLEQLPDTGGAQAQVTPTCAGWQKHLDDNSSATMVYVDRDLTKWIGPSLTRQIALVGASYQLAGTTVAPDQTSLNPSLVQEIDDSWVSPWEPINEAWYDAGPNNLIAKVYYSVTRVGEGADANWIERIIFSSDANETSTQNMGTIGVSGGSGYATPSTTYRFVELQHFYNATPAGTPGAKYFAYWDNMAVYGNHGLTGHGSDPVGLYASDIIAHAVGTWAPKLAYTTGANGTIQTSSFVIPHIAFNSPTTVSQIIKQAAQYEILDWAVWEGPTFYCNALGQSAKTRNWISRVGPAQLQETGPNVSRLWNGVMVTFQNVDGTVGTVGPPGSGAGTTSSTLQDSDPENPCNQIGIDRWALLQMGTSTSAGAIQTGAVFLAQSKLLDTSGQASLVGHVQDTTGAWWPAWMVRAGDTIQFVDAADTSARRIVSTSYDDSTRTNTIQLDQPPDSLTALLDRLSVVLSPFGLQ